MNDGEQSSTSFPINLPSPNNEMTNLYDPYILQPQSPLCIYQQQNSAVSPITAIFPKTSTFIPVHKCPQPQIFTFSPQTNSLPWASAHSGTSASQPTTILPTSISGAYVNQDIIAAGTPEYIHPRNSNLPQWLMSPPVVEGDPNIISYTSMKKKSAPADTVSKTLLTPDDFKIPQTTECAVSALVSDKLLLQKTDIGANFKPTISALVDKAKVYTKNSPKPSSNVSILVNDSKTDSKHSMNHLEIKDQNLGHPLVGCKSSTQNETTIFCAKTITPAKLGSMSSTCDGGPNCLQSNVSTLIHDLPQPPSQSSNISNENLEAKLTSTPYNINCDSDSKSLRSSQSHSKLFDYEMILKDLFMLCKRCTDFADFQCALSDFFLHRVYTALLPYLFYPHFSHEYSQLNHFNILKKLSSSIATFDANRDAKHEVFPIGVFWDIENCAVPNGKSAMDIVKKIREEFFTDHAEAEFMAVCDINKESKHVIQDLNNAQVNVIHVNATAKNAADDKLRQSIRRYAQTHSAPATVILITGDCNFTSEVSDLRHRHKYFVVLIHPTNTSSCLMQAANTVVSYNQFVANVPIVYVQKDLSNGESYLQVSNLPMHVDVNSIRSRLKQLSNNCGGKVFKILPPTATLMFATEDLARRALKRLGGEIVFGSKIVVSKKFSDLSAHSKGFTPKRRWLQQTHLEHRMRYTPGHSNNQVDHHSNTVNRPTTRYAADTSGVQLTISNIDSKLGVKAIQEAVWKMVTEHSTIWKLQIRPHNRFTVMCDVTVPDVSAASCILQHLHRRKIGSKRILVTITQRQSEQIANIKKELLPIIREFGQEGIHIKKIINMYWQSYHKKITFNDLQNLQDFLTLEERCDGVFVSLKRFFDRPSTSVCRMHFKEERAHRYRFVKIEIGLREFSAKLHALLHSHNGSVYLNGFEQCYQAEFGIFPYPEDCDTGVYLEHQISYVPGVQILDDGHKVVVWSQPQSDVGSGSDTASEASVCSRSKTSNAVSFSREMVDLLKTQPYCCLPVSEFKVAYQTHFGHSLRAGSDSLDPFSAMPHVVQILGNKPDQVLTLTHRSQVKRFTHEIIKILKSSPDKAILMAQLPDMYGTTFGRPWNLRDYGVSVLSDLLDDIPDGNICVSGEGENIVLSLPTRERTAEEIERTNQFARELVEILKSRHRCRMSFTEFVPAYHRQFGRQCKLANYGFTKLVDLFESLPNVVQVVDGPEKFLQLTNDEQLKVLTSQIIGMLRHADGGSVQLPLARVQTAFSHKYGFPLVPHHYNCVNAEALIGKLSHAVKVVQDVDGTLVVKQAERKPIRLLCAQLLVLLLDITMDQVDQDQLHQVYRDRYSESIIPSEYGFLSLNDVLKKAISGVAKFDQNDGETQISLKPIYQRAKRIRSILLSHGESMTLGEFNQAYRTRFGEPLDAERHGFRSCEAMLRALSMILVVKGFGIKKVVVLRNHMQHGPLSSSISAPGDRKSDNSQVTCATSSGDNGVNKQLRDLISSTRSPPKIQKLDDLNSTVRNNEDSFRPFNADRCPGSKRPNAGYKHLTSRNSSRDFSAPAAREFPALGNRGAVGSDPFYVFEPSVEQYHQYQCDSGMKHNDLGYTTPNAGGGQYHQFREGSYQSPLTTYVERGGGEIGARKAAERSAVALQDLYNRSSDSQQGRRRFSLSVITLPTGTTSISSTPSPDSALSTNEDSTASSDESRFHDEGKKTSPGRLRLAASFAAVVTSL